MFRTVPAVAMKPSKGFYPYASHGNILNGLSPEDFEGSLNNVSAADWWDDQNFVDPFNFANASLGVETWWEAK